MSKPTGFHVRHDLQPDLTYELLTLFGAASSELSEQALRERAEVHGYKLRRRSDYSKLLKSLTELDIVNVSNSLFHLTELGQLIYRLTSYQRDLLPEFVHFLYFTLWDANPCKRFSWSYQIVCRTLWETAPSVVNRDRLVYLVIQNASERFQTNSVSFSTSSVAGILNWLNELLPSCLIHQDNDICFQRREYCSVELFALALNHVYLRLSTTDGPYISVTENFRQEVSSICLIPPGSFYDMLAQAETHLRCITVRRERGERIAINNFSWATLED